MSSSPKDAVDEDSPMRGYKNFYEVLGVSPGDATAETIQRAYREVVKNHHPDVSDDPDQGMLDLAQVAKEVLSDPDSREQYDALGHNMYARHHLDGEYLLEEARERTNWSQPGETDEAASSGDQATSAGRHAPSGSDLGTGSSPGAERRQPDDVDVGEYSHDEAYDFLQEDDPGGEYNAPGHVEDVHLQTWLLRIGAIVALLGTVGGVVAVGGLSGDTAAMLFGVTVVGGAAVVVATGIRAERRLYRGADEQESRQSTEVWVGVVLMALSLVASGLGSGSGAVVWGEARALLLGLPSTGGLWIAASSTRGAVVNYLGAIATVVGAVLGGSLLFAGVTDRGWHSRFVAGERTHPTLWDVAGFIPLLAIYWGVVFGPASAGPMSSILLPLVGPNTAVVFNHIGYLGCWALLVVAVGQHLRAAAF